MPYLIIVSLVWGFSFVIIKGTLTSLDSSFVSFARLLLSLIAFLPFLRPAGMRPSEMLQLMGIGSLQFGLMYLAYIAAFQYLPAHVIALLTTTTPIFVSVFAGMFAGAFRRRSLLAAGLAVAGGAVLEFPDQPFAASLRGIVLVQISNAAFAAGQILYGKWMHSRTGLQDRSIFALLYAGGAAIAGIFSLFATDYAGISLQPYQWSALLYLGLIASGVSFFLWNVGARKVEAGLLAVMNNMKIPVAVIASIVLLGEPTEWPRLLAGCALLAAALYLNERSRRGR